MKKYFAIKKAALPEGPFEDAGNITVSVEGASSFRALIRSGRVSELVDPLGQIAGYVNEQFSGADYLHAQRVRELLQKKMEALFDSFDLLVTVTQPVTATPLELNLETGLSFADPLGGIGNSWLAPATMSP